MSLNRHTPFLIPQSGKISSCPLGGRLGRGYFNIEEFFLLTVIK